MFMCACLFKVNEVVYRGKSDEQQEEQGEEMLIKKKEITQIKKRKLKQVDATVLSDEEVDEVNIEPDGIYEDDQGSRPKKRKKSKKIGYSAEMVEGDKVKSESNEEPPLPSVGDKRKQDNVEVKKETIKKKVVAAERQVSVNKGKQKINEGSLVSFKKGKKDKDEGVLMVVEKGKEVVLNEKVKCDPVNILTRMSPSHLKNVLDSLTTQHVSVLEELGLGEYHNNFNFTTTPGALGMWIVKNYDHEEHTIKMVDGRKIKVTWELNHEILGVPMGEIKVNALLNTTSEDLIYCSSIVLPTTVVERKAPIFKHWSIELLKERQVEEKNRGFGQLLILEEIGSMSREEELEQFKSKIVQDMKDCLSDNLLKIKALLLDTDDKIKIALDENPENSDLKMILGKRLAFFKELNHHDDDNAMVVLDNGNDVPGESVKYNEVSKEKDDVTKKDVEK
ncbi:hypothetical protein Tco_0690755, partial [Tanacetum coccineum]